jgi:integrase
MSPVFATFWALIWAPAARKAGIPKGTGLHSLRHYFATRLKRRGVAADATFRAWREDDAIRDAGFPRRVRVMATSGQTSRSE